MWLTWRNRHPGRRLQRTPVGFYSALLQLQKKDGGACATETSQADLRIDWSSAAATYGLLTATHFSKWMIILD
ncbi:MAG: hypothetical protein H7A18_07045 [Sinobacteraceae bacterium]|nr:hypothetical protein [Nevskiaceae bacterium]